MNIPGILTSWLRPHNYGGHEAAPDEVSAEWQGERPQRKRQGVVLKLASARDKYIYSMEPQQLDDASVAAEYLKRGCAVFLNLQEAQRSIGQRIVDTMTGVCYGVGGHFAKVGDRLFLFAPPGFALTSDDQAHMVSEGLLVQAFSEPERTLPAPEPAVAEVAQSFPGVAAAWRGR